MCSDLKQKDTKNKKKGKNNSLAEKTEKQYKNDNKEVENVDVDEDEDDRRYDIEEEGPAKGMGNLWFVFTWEDQEIKY